MTTNDYQRQVNLIMIHRLGGIVFSLGQLVNFNFLEIEMDREMSGGGTVDVVFRLNRLHQTGGIDTQLREIWRLLSI